MRYLASLFLLGLLGCSPADDRVSGAAAPAERDVAVSATPVSATNGASVTSSANSSTSQSVSSSTSSGSTSSITNSTTTSANGTSSCSAEHNGRRCEVRCRSPQQAYCVKPADASEPTCVCK